MYYDKKIRYLSYYESDIKLQNAGYVKFQVRDSLCQMIIYVKGPRLMGSGEAAVYLLSGKDGQENGDSFYSGGRGNSLRKHLLGNLNICNGQGHCAVRMNAENMADSGLWYDEICGIKIELHEYQYLESRWSAVNFMPRRQEAQQGETMGYRLRRPQNDSQNTGRSRESGRADTGEQWKRGESTKPENAPVEISLIVTPVSENSRVEKLVREEPAEEITEGKAQKEDAVTGMPERRTVEELALEVLESNGEDMEAEAAEVQLFPAKETGESGEEKPERTAYTEKEAPVRRMPDDEEETSMQEMLEQEVRKEEERSQRSVQSVQSEQAGQQEQIAGEKIMQGAEQVETLETGDEIGSEIGPEEQVLQPDKWEQLRKTYPIVHPIREDEEYLKIAPKDFVIFTEKYQELVHNSFLLHGYYNYKHLILGKKEREGRVIYYLGVPGTFHDREKAVAVMFGFEAFDGKREPAENGDFGYYLRRVEI